MGIRQVFGLLLLPVTTDLDVNRGVFGLVIGLQNLLWGVTQPVPGLLADRFGAGRVIATGGLLMLQGWASAPCAATPRLWTSRSAAWSRLAQSGDRLRGGVGRHRPRRAAGQAAAVRWVSPRPPARSACSHWCHSPRASFRRSTGAGPSPCWRRSPRHPRCWRSGSGEPKSAAGIRRHD